MARAARAAGRLVRPTASWPVAARWRSVAWSMRLSLAEKASLYGHAGVNALGLLGARTAPPAIIWVLTQRCFYRCVHCDSWRDDRPIDGTALLAIADQIAGGSTRMVALSGGEPFAVKVLPDIVRRLKDAGKRLTINTNGHLLAQHADWVVEAGVDHVQVSVDGHTAALHDAIRGTPGSFEHIERGIAALLARRHDRLPHVSVCGTLMPANVAHAAAFVDRFAGVADAVEMQPLHDSPGLLATAGTPAFTAADRPHVEHTLDAIMQRHGDFATDFYRTFPRFLFEPETMHDVAVDHCLPMIFNTLTIREDGACRICRYPLEQNLATRTIAEVWNSPQRWALYRRLARDGCGEPCWIRCHIHPSPWPGRPLRRLLRALPD